MWIAILSSEAKWEPLGAEHNGRGEFRSSIHVLSPPQYGGPHLRLSLSPPQDYHHPTAILTPAESL